MTKATKVQLKKFENTKIKVVKVADIKEPSQNNKQILAEGSCLKFLDNNSSVIGMIDLHCGQIYDFTDKKPGFIFLISRMGAFQLNLQNYNDFKIIYSSISRLTKISYSPYLDAILISDIEDSLKILPLLPDRTTSTFPGILQFEILDNLLATFNSTGKVALHLLNDEGKSLGINKSIIFDNQGNWDEYVTFLAWRSKTVLIIKLSNNKILSATIDV
jgi:hypothetical protein